MIKRMVMLMLGASAAISAVAAQAATFDFSFSAPVMQFGSAGDTYLGQGQLFADDQGGGMFNVTGATGTTSIDGFPEYSYEISGGAGTLVFSAGAFTADGLVLTGNSGPGYYGFTLNPGLSTYSIQLGEVGAPEGALTITPGAGSVPEPATWAMLILGAGATGLAMRRRQKALVSIAA